MKLKYCILYIIILIGTAIGFYFWYNSFYFPTDDDGKCVISGYTYDIKEIQTYNKIVYSCLPLVFVNYRFNGEHFYNIRTKLYKMKSFNEGISINNLNQTSIDHCLDYFNENMYAVGEDINDCYVVKSKKSPSYVCRTPKREELFDNGCCNDGLMNMAAFKIVAVMVAIMIVFAGIGVVRELHYQIKSRRNTSTVTRQVTSLRNIVDNITQTVIIQPVHNENNAIYMNDTCSICKSSEANMILFPCGHNCICNECYNSMKHKKCPICRSIVISTSQVVRDTNIDNV